MATLHTTTDIARWRFDKVRRRSGDELTASKTTVYRWLVTVGALLCLFRGTQMWPGYPTTQEEFGSVDPLYMQLIVYFLLLLNIVALALRPAPLLRALRGANIFLLLSILAVIVSIIASQDVGASLRGIVAVIVMTLPVLLYYFEFGSVRMQALIRRWAMFVVVANIVYAAILPHYGFMTGSLAGMMRGMFLHKNLFGQYFAVLFIVFFGSLIGPASRERSRLVDAAFCVAALGCVVLSRSSTGVMISGAGIIGLALARFFELFPVRGPRQLVIFAMLFAFLGLVAVGGPLIVAELVGSTGKDLTFSGRTRIWEALIPHIFDHPWTGHGFSMFRNVYYIDQFTARLTSEAKSTHNTYLELLLTIGIPGTVVWLTFVLCRLFTKLASGAPSPSLRAAHHQEAAIIIMTLIGSTMEAGQMLAPLAIWPMLAACLPLGRIVAAGPKWHGRPAGLPGLREPSPRPAEPYPSFGRS